MFGSGYDWTNDVAPIMANFMNAPIVKGALIALVAISVAVLGARGIISIFFKRD